ncbi:hypothetical protein [Chelativorans oligotrophicus]|uniref:hypothetical protein n=1 Tax=Chelativorans oligotrophicus TaxID=449974 RepID=UPI001409FB38|nr:hypothetical protein [Chelativorans oligotrophicus]
MFGLGTWIQIGIVLAVMSGLAWSHSAAYRAGRSAEQAAFVERINQENEDAGNSAEDWRSQYRRCVDAGGLFDFETGACDR